MSSWPISLIFVAAALIFAYTVFHSGGVTPFPPFPVPTTTGVPPFPH